MSIKVSIDPKIGCEDVSMWCLEHFGNKWLNWYNFYSPYTPNDKSGISYWFFKNKEDATLFKLTWG